MNGAPQHVRLGLIGFGTVGRGLVELLAERGDALARAFGLRVGVHAVADLRLGGVASDTPLPPNDLLQATEAGSFADVPANRRGLSALELIHDQAIDVVAELSFTNLEDGEPALTHVREALRAGRHVISTNKGPVALRFPELLELASEQGVGLGVEGTVMSGTPTLGLGTHELAGAGVHAVRGILNGTTNFMLQRMDQGDSFEDALADAQRQGYAEADASGDVDGIDAAGKVVILANLVLNAPLTMADVPHRGIRDLTPSDLASAAKEGETWKLIGEARRQQDGSVVAKVAPQRLPLDAPFATVSGVANACTFETELLGDVTLIGPGAGRRETGFALLHDLLALHRTRPGGLQRRG